MGTLDSKDKKYAAAVEKALGFFDSVEEWADHISFLSKLLKALQQKHTTQHWIPHDLKISITLSKCLSPNLPSGVHQKTIEVYNFIFKELGVDALASNVNIWIPGILPIMQFASISIKPAIIDLYKNYLLTLPSNVLKSVVKPILSYLLPSIDDERSEFFDTSIALIDSLRTELKDDSLFWQSVFLIIITSEERRLGCLIWCNKRLPDLNVVIEPPEDTKNDVLNYYKSELKKRLTSEQLALITPEPGLLIRSFIATLKSDNILIQRGFLDLMIKKVQLNSTVLQKLSPEKDLQNLIISAISAVLKKDMSINRRIWNWLLGPETSNAVHVEYFQNNGAVHLKDGLLKLFDGKYDQQPSYQQKLVGYKICLAIMDRWEIGSQVVPDVLIPLLKSVQQSSGLSPNEFNEILKSASALFDAVETLTIWSNLSKMIKSENIDFLIFVLQNFNVQDEEMIIHQFPLFFITSLIKSQQTEGWFKLLNLAINTIPQRAYLPIKHASHEISELSKDDILNKIAEYYENNDVLALPFKPADLSKITLDIVTDLVIKNISAKEQTFDYVLLLNCVIDSIPELNFYNAELVNIIKSSTFRDSVLINIAKLFPKLHFDSPFTRIDILRNLIFQLCSLLKEDGIKYQVEVVKALHQLSLSTSSNYVEAALTSYILDLKSLNDRLIVFNYLWIHSTEATLLDRPLHILLDDLHDMNHSNYSILQRWIVGNINSGLINRLFQLITLKLSETVDDKSVFSYHCSIVLNVLNTDLKGLLPLFKEELSVINSVEYKNEDISTYKEFTLYALEKFLNKGQFNAKSSCVVFKLIELLLDGREKNFEHLVQRTFELSQSFIINKIDDVQYESVSIILLDHIKELIKVLISTRAKIPSIFESPDNEQSPFIKFLLLSFLRFNSSDLLSSWIELLVTTFKYQDESIFEFVEPIILQILKKVNSFYFNGSESKDDVSISLLLGVLQELLSLVRSYVVTLEVNGTKNTNHDPGFFSSVVSGVLGDSSKHLDADSVISKNRRTMNICFAESTKICFEIWKESDASLKKRNDTQGDLSIKYQSLKLKHKSKMLLEKLYELESVEVLKTMILVNNVDYPVVFKVLNVLDGTRPQLTIPHIFKLINTIVRSTNKQQSPNVLETSVFLVEYARSLQNDSIEDVYDDSMNFLKEVSSDLSTYKLILINVVKFISVIAQKLRRSKFGEQKKTKKEIGDMFLKILPASLNFKNVDVSSAIATSINDTESKKTEDIDNNDALTSSVQLDAPSNQEELFSSVSSIVPSLSAIVSENDKLSTIVSTILINLITPNLKSKNAPKTISSYHLELLEELSKDYSSVKSLKFLISEAFNDSQFFNANVEDTSYWNAIIKNWIKNDAGDKLSEYINRLTSSNASNIFNWNENEQVVRAMTLKRIAYLLLVCDKDQHIVLLKEIFDKLGWLFNQNISSSAEIFLVIRSVLLRFSPIHLYDHWTFIYTMLQQFFLMILTADKAEVSRLNTNTIFQASKLLDLLLVLKFEDFQEWIFIIDTINAIYRNVDIVSLIDKISLRDELFESSNLTNEKSELLTKLSESKGLRKPALIGIRQIGSMSSLKPFFDGLSYYNYENIYNGANMDYESCEQDILFDLFDGF